MHDIRVLPAIDLKGGRCVRLRQGRAEDETVYSEHPAEVAKQWAAQGAEYLHVVDLDGAFRGHPVHLKEIDDIVAAVRIPVQVGGGLRTDADIAEVLGLGVHRVILGTAVTSDPTLLGPLCEEFPEGIAVGIDARDGWVQIKGWKETIRQQALDLAREVARYPISAIIYTDTSRDGMLQGVNAEAVGAICRAVERPVIASGGVSTPEDMRRLRELGRANLEGAIVGKALYDGTVTFRALERAGRGEAEAT